jgi:hypothetical protein
LIKKTYRELHHNNFRIFFLPLDVEVGGEGDAVVLVVDPQHLLDVDNDRDVVRLQGVGQFKLRSENRSSERSTYYRW